MTKGETNTETASFHRDNPAADPLRVRYERIVETLAELERARSVKGPSSILGTEHEIEAAKVMLMADAHQQASYFNAEVVRDCTEREIISATEAKQLETKLQRLSREQELLQMRRAPTDRSHDRER